MARFATAVALQSTAKMNGHNKKANAKMRVVSNLMPRAGDKLTPKEWADKVNANFDRTVASILETGRLIREAHADLKGIGSKWAEFRSYLKFGDSEASKYAKIGDMKLFYKQGISKRLPASVTTIYVLAQLPEDALAKFIEKGDVHPNMTRSDAERLLDSIQNPKEKKAKEPKPDKKTQLKPEPEPVKAVTRKSEVRAPINVDTGPSQDPYQIAYENWINSIESAIDFSGRLEEAMEKAKVNKIPREDMREVTQLINILERFVREYA